MNWEITCMKNKTFIAFAIENVFYFSVVLAEATQTIIIVIIAQPTWTTVWNPRLDAVFKGIQVWTFLDRIRKHCIPNNWPKTTD